MIPGVNTIDLSDAAVAEALRRFLCDELKEPITVNSFKKKDVGYDSFMSVTFSSETKKVET
ncbi:MAG: hypothetical protein EKK55_16880 [Rhodocyclaceae bacterium]|nr:MAG: hypothetical protein EKK55_16880 [Rhodocyclaceae bacterium]